MVLVYGFTFPLTEVIRSSISTLLEDAMAKIVIKDLKMKKSLTKKDIKEVIGGGIPVTPLSSLVGPIVLPKSRFNLNPDWFTPSVSTQNTSCCDGYICQDGKAIPV